MQLPLRTSLAHRAAESLHKEIRAGTVTGTLPSERSLCQSLQVSRSTLRVALQILREEGVLKTRHGSGTRVCIPDPLPLRPESSVSIGILISVKVDYWRHFISLVVDDLRSRLSKRRQSLEVYAHSYVASAAPGARLAKLTEEKSHAAWVLIGCSHQTQEWFTNHDVPALVSGTSLPDLHLPCVTLDNQALGRHAAATLLRLGHRRIGLVLRPGNPGLRAGLNEVFARRSPSPLSVRQVEVDDEPGSIPSGIDRLFADQFKPTALFVAESDLYLSVMCLLAQRQIRVPQDCGLLCRDEEPFFNALYPSPCRYRKNPHHYAKKIDDMIRGITNGELLQQRVTRIMPTFVPGDSLVSP